MKTGSKSIRPKKSQSSPEESQEIEDLSWIDYLTDDELLELEALEGLTNQSIWKAPYNEDTPAACYLFVTQCCWTYNEADGPIELIPDKEYVKALCYEWWECRKAGKTLIIEKSRRLIVSWILRGLELWALGIKRGKHVIVGLNYPKAAEHVWRIWFMWEQLCKRKQWHKPDDAIHRGGNPDGQKLDEVVLPNGSMISKINQSADSFQGSGYSGVTHEEFSLYDYPAAMFSQSRFVTQGVPGQIGGFVVIVTNSAPNQEWWDKKQAANGELDIQGKIAHIKAREVLGLDEVGKTCLVMRGFAACETKGGARYIAMHYSADESKDDVWAANERREHGAREWDQQMEMVEEIYDGEPVYKDFSESRHIPKSVREQGVPIIRQSVYVGGWDIGLTPAFVLLQITPDYQIHAILEVVSDGGEPMQTFAPRVLKALQGRLPGRWDEVYHGADATVINRTATTGDTVQKIAKAFGPKLRPQSNVLSVRLSAVSWALVDEIDERTPRFIVDPVHCPVLTTGFKGAYKYEDAPRGDTMGPGRITNLPLKNSFSHIHDSLQYSCIIAKKFCEGKLKIR